MLEPTLAEIEAHVHAGGWDQRPALFALVRADRFAAADPDTAARLGIDGADNASFTPIEQEELPDRPLDEVLTGIAWPDSVDGCALTQEILMLPPSADPEIGDSADPTAVTRAAAHPSRREARLVAGVLRDGTTAVLLRLRGEGGAADDVLTGPDLAPNLLVALRATLD